MVEQGGGEVPADEVATASAAWIWVPDDGERIDAEDYTLVRYPAYFTDPTQVLRVGGSREPAEMVAEVHEQVRAWGRDEVMWWFPEGVRDDLREHLLGLGARPAETLDVLARPLPGAEVPVPADVEVVPVEDEATARQGLEVDVAVFGGSMPSDAEIAAVVERDRADAAAGTAIKWLALLDGRPVGLAGATLADGVLRLWGGGVLPEMRGRGVYRALLADRLAWGVERGARFALVKGRVETSGPILRRAGFTAYGVERSFSLNS